MASAMHSYRIDCAPPPPPPPPPPRRLHNPFLWEAVFVFISFCWYRPSAMFGAFFLFVFRSPLTDVWQFNAKRKLMMVDDAVLVWRNVFA